MREQIRAMVDAMKNIGMPWKALEDLRGYLTPSEFQHILDYVIVGHDGYRIEYR